MITITYFVHGTTTDNEQGKATGWLPGELSERGIEQSEKLPKQITDNSFEVVFCSDLGRAIDSARLGFGDTHTIAIDKRLREANYGEYNGREHVFKDKMADFIEKPFSGGESYGDVERRIKSFLDMLKLDYPGKHIAIVAHEAPQLALEVLVNGKTWREAIETNWRKTKAWQPGWTYSVEEGDKS